MNKFVLLVEFQVKPDDLTQFMDLVNANAHASVADEPGCLQFDVMQTLDDPCKVVLYEVYASENAFKEHMAMPHTQSFLAAGKTFSQWAKRGSRCRARPHRLSSTVKGGI
ncbi:putative quinol monooxygenase [Undibacterium arcticum]